jgi:geranylgeranyl diphosphate synthase, type II
MLTLQECQEIIHNRLKEIKIPESPSNLYDPIRYMLEPEGKRIRPVLVLMGCNVFSEDISQAIYPAMAVEVFHNFTLLHDDIMDQSVMRRNRPTVHVKWNPNIGILSGDAMLIKAYELLVAEPAASLVKILGLFNKTAMEVCEGQQFDMDFECNTNINLKEYLNMVELKTAVLLAASVKMGAIIGGADEANAQLLYEFGRNIGIAFQLQDDLLDVYADTLLFGKIRGNDIVSNKKTVLLIQALQMAQGRMKRELLNWLKTGTFDREEKIKGVTDIYSQLNLKEITASQVKVYHERALAMLNQLRCEPERKVELSAFSELLMNRKK